MAKNENKDSAGDRERQLEFIRNGEQVEGGWCVDFDHPEVVYRCSEEEERMARGEISVSADRSTVLDLASGELVEREPDFRRATSGPFVQPTGDVATMTGNGGGGRGPVANAGGGNA
jgi:hypothetical protein